MLKGERGGGGIHLSSFNSCNPVHNLKRRVFNEGVWRVQGRDCERNSPSCVELASGGAAARVSVRGAVPDKSV